MNVDKYTIEDFVRRWSGKGYEKGEKDSFWTELLGEIFSIRHPSEFINFEKQVEVNGQTKFIDGFIKKTHVLIEQKNSSVNLDKPERQSDGELLTPFEQAQRYAANLPYFDKVRWIIVCNFKEFRIYDIGKSVNPAPVSVKLYELPKHYNVLKFIVDEKYDYIKKETELSMKAGEIVGKLYNALRSQMQKQFANLDEKTIDKNINELCVRLVFCFYAEDSDLFRPKGAFHDYLMKYPAEKMDVALKRLFKILNIPQELRDSKFSKELLSFPYVNGGLFRNTDVLMPTFNEEIKKLILEEASESFNWSEISPTIFGAVFESTLNPETRRKGGMHYTSLENIHKVIDPLFLNDLRTELEKIKFIKNKNQRDKKLAEYRYKLGKLKFLDPACGSGNFLTETYLSLRELENDALRSQYAIGKAQQTLMDEMICVKIDHFYGIEINDFACRVAETALWISESQMLKETQRIIPNVPDFLPIQTTAHIVEGNALRIDWNDVIPKEKLNYIMGNPPFVGHQWRNAEQVRDMEFAFKDLKIHGKLDYVCAWYVKAVELMENTNIKTAFVSTNSICQGESVPILWHYLFNKKNAEILFAHKSFIWSSEAKDKAAVHCVIIGFCCFNLNANKLLYENGTFKQVKNINGYLMDAPNIFIQNRSKQLFSTLQPISKGSQATDGGFLILSKEEKDNLIKKYPETNELIKRYIGAEEFINNKVRYCLWLCDISPQKYRNIKPIVERLNNVRDFRLSSPTLSVRKDSERPMLFTQIRQPNTAYLAIPRVSSKNRKYIPIGFMKPDVILSDRVNFISNADLYMFGILSSNIHNSWMRVVAGRLKSDYNYSPFVYNNFPWPTPTKEQEEKIKRTAQGILDARKKHPDCSLAVLYDPVTMPDDLVRHITKTIGQ